MLYPYLGKRSLGSIKVEMPANQLSCCRIALHGSLQMIHLYLCKCSLESMQVEMPANQLSSCSMALHGSLQMLYSKLCKCSMESMTVKVSLTTVFFGGAKAAPFPHP